MKINKGNNSKKHHYLPVFYLRNFTNEKGFLFVYDKQKDEIIKQPKSPKSVFFEWHRNTTVINSRSNNLLEELYSMEDNDFAPRYKKILKRNDTNLDLESKIETIIEYLLFINFIRWRNPIKDEFINHLFDKYCLKDLSYNIVDSNGEEVLDQKSIKAITELEIFKKGQASLIIFEPFYNNEHILNISQNFNIFDQNNYPNFISDCPYIEKSNSTDIKKFSEFVFTLTKQKVAVYVKNFRRKKLDQDFTLLMELAKFESAKKYIACADKELLEKVANEYRRIRMNGNNGRIIPSLFEYLESE